MTVDSGSMREGLKPCPFCGGEVVAINHFVGAMMEHAAMCDNSDCMAQGPWRDTAEEAIAAWNQRPREDALRASGIAAMRRAEESKRERDELAQAMVKMGTIAPHNVCVFCVQFVPSHKPDCPVLKAAAYLKEAK